MEQVTNDMMELKRQINQLKTSKENLKLENRRLTNDLAAFECNNIKFKTKLSESDKEIDRLKKQLQQYVQEVQRAEELLHRKEEERNEMLEQYRTLSHGKVAIDLVLVNKINQIWNANYPKLNYFYNNVFRRSST